MLKNLSFNISGLPICPKNRQTVLARVKQGKFLRPENFSANLSTISVDFFPLALGSLSLQPRGRINASKRRISA
jgi:hypothetical protein